MSVTESVDGSAATQSRRSLFRSPAAGLAAATALGAVTMMSSRTAQAAAPVNDNDIFNFALNFEYLGAEYYLRAVLGSGLDTVDPTLITSTYETAGAVTTPPGSTLVPFSDPAVADFAIQLANDELAHVRVVRAVVGQYAIARPAIDFDAAYTAFATAAGLISPGQTFNPFANELNFLLGAYLLEDTCVTALTGGAALITDKVKLQYAAGLLGVESQQAGAIRSFLAQFGAGTATNAISALRAKLSGVGDQGTADEGNPFNISNGDGQAQAFRRTPAQVLAIAFGGAGKFSGGIFPNGVGASNIALASS